MNKVKKCALKTLGFRIRLKHEHHKENVNHKSKGNWRKLTLRFKYMEDIVDDQAIVYFGLLIYVTSMVGSVEKLLEIEIKGLILTPCKVEGHLEATSPPSGRGKTVYISPFPLPCERRDWVKR
nr:hypothetical protein [Tanacetum cinerariifolium]